MGNRIDRAGPAAERPAGFFEQHAQDAAIEALRKITGKEFTDPSDWHQWWKTNRDRVRPRAP